MQSESDANRAFRQTEWQGVDWRHANRIVRNLRRRIFRASQEGDFDKVSSLQRLMMRSRSNTLTSVRRVTQQNKGKFTAGIDKVVVKTPTARGKLVDEISSYTPWAAKPARRVYIPKSNGKQRPLGIPVIRDRCIQAIVKNALEPEWEAKFEGISYGFRPGRSAHDAIAKIYALATPHRSKKWVVDADIKGAFDNISHDFLLDTIKGFPARELVKQWLKAGYLDGNTFQETEAGTPQGGVVSPLLANIALHGMEEALTVRRIFPNGKVIISDEGVKYVNRKDRTNENVGKRAVVRYADDFVVFCETKEDAERCVEILRNWLKMRGLELSPEKTSIVHLTEGFDFLGFNVKHYEHRKTAKTGWKLLIKPSQKSVKRIRAKLREMWLALKGHNVNKVIMKLNPVIRGWANYHRVSVATDVFREVDDWMFHRAIRYTKSTHPTKSWEWRNKRYFGSLSFLHSNWKWLFGDFRTGIHLLKLQWFPIERHAVVLGMASPDDASLKEYWEKRNAAKAKDLSLNKSKIAKKQNGKCLRCGDSLFNGEEIHTHHIQWKSRGGKDTQSNYELVHMFCHQQIHAGEHVEDETSEYMKAA